MERRKFIKKSALATLTGLVGAEIVFGRNMLANYKPMALQKPNPYDLFGKDKQMVVLNDRPWNLEAQAHLLRDAVTPNKFMFIRNNGFVPDNIDVENWKLQIDGESVKESKTYSLSELKSKFKKYTYQLTLECGGNGRSEFNPPAKGNQWTVGAVHCANWTGIRLKDVLQDAGVKEDAVYIGYHAADIHLSRDPDKEPISRGIPISKAMQNEILLAFEMNGEKIPLAHGYPLRLVVGGWPASTSGKWLQRISIRNKIHDGAKMGGMSYRVPCKSIAPGEKIAEDEMCIIESMPVKSIITYPKSGAILSKNTLNLEGHAWAGDLEVKKMEVSIDFGATWDEISISKPVNNLAWQHFNTHIVFPKKGYYEVWVKATDANNVSQPMVLPGWNPKGYLNNACHRIAVKVKS